MKSAEAKGFRNDDDQPLYVTSVAERAPTKSAPARKSILSRHVYRLNGVELSPSAKPTRGEAYLIEIKGDNIGRPKGGMALVQDRDNGLRPLGCPLSQKLDTLPFLPWLSTEDLSPTLSCETSAHDMSVALQTGNNDKASISVVYFAHIDAATIEDLAPPEIRFLK